ncbi:expressed protein [Arabidopsis lyrata subsp. lyrata]|uniref:Expressed protein n=1 Tax=Arabidopsis lyrata subsp. lyrata TaxID=81972 RepID=D7KYI2_ARALL|nr:expressed protein [Arabidopsis lyrata subsp. lyrata]
MEKPSENMLRRSRKGLVALFVKEIRQAAGFVANLRNRWSKFIRRKPARVTLQYEMIHSS